MVFFSIQTLVHDIKHRIWQSFVDKSVTAGHFSFFCISFSFYLSVVLWFFCILYFIHCVSKNGTHIMPHNSRKCGPILIIRSL